MNRFETTDIFTPSSTAFYTFVERMLINDQLVLALKTKGMQIIIYGHSGSGKTTLLYNKLNQTYAGHITTRCTLNLTFEQLVINAFDELGRFYTTIKSSSKSLKINTQITGDYKIIKGMLGGDFSYSKNEETRPIVPPQLTPQKLASFFGESNYCWVIEDFHKMASGEKKKLAQYMKVFMDESFRYPSAKIIVIGAVNTVDQIIELDKELNNRVTEILVPFMSDGELLEIIEKGEQKLNISINPDVKKKIISLSCGLPAVVHQLCLNLCNAESVYQTLDSRITFDIRNLKDSLGTFLLNKSGYLLKKYENAIAEPENNPLPLYFHILKCFIDSKSNNLKLKDVKKYFDQKNQPQQEYILEYLLNQLTKESKGEVLIYDEPSATWSIHDPFFKMYCICAYSFTDLDLKSQLELFSVESVEKSKNKIKMEQKELIRKALSSGTVFDF